ncbi:hypothetical protein SAMN05216553_102637 [Lentzea fradiae]|uniref:Uncharacterized protein n=1 Tax=Lentzea fradiae TaxID=200378 RepID=A0A1G7N2J9_9PSEU|nr:hypothetical protein [Lentzea fradiae]SDF68137.1 hypothetical protein SAMN05216553_102637 [Lentzea fradiae]
MDEQPGKHRVDEAVAPPWARPAGGGGRIPHPRRDVDPLQDTDGLRKFNIGLVPASVTPPGTWRRAAWFAVVSSVLVLVGLSVAAAKLVGGSGGVDPVGLPGYPSDVPLISQLPTGGTTPPVSDTPEAAMATGRRVLPQDTGAGREPAPSGRASVPTTSGTSPSRTSASGALPPIIAAPVITTLPVTQEPIVDGSEIARRTESFYRAMVANAEAALALTTDAVRSNAGALLDGKLSDIELIEVREIAVDPGSGVTVSVLRVTRKDGSVSTEKRELSFTLGEQPLINGERLKTGG